MVGGGNPHLEVQRGADYKIYGIGETIVSNPSKKKNPRINLTRRLLSVVEPVSGC